MTLFISWARQTIYDISTGETHYMKAVSVECQRTVDSEPPLQNIARKSI